MKSFCFGFLAFFIFFTPIIQAQKLEHLLLRAVISEDSSEIYFSRAEKLLKTNRDKALYFQYKNSKATDTGIPDSAIYYGNRALSYYIQLKDTASMYLVYNNLAKSWQKKGAYEKAIGVLLSGLKLAEKKGEIRWQGNYLINISLNYHDFEDYNKGVRYGKNAIRVLKSNPSTPPFTLVLALNAIAINFDDWQKPDSALFYHYRILDLKDKIDTLQIGFTYNNIGNTLLKQKKFREAESWIIRSMRITDRNRKNLETNAYHYEKATNYTNMVKVYMGLKNNPKARNFLDSTEKEASLSRSIEKRRDYYQIRYEFNKSIRNFEEAMKYQDMYFQIRDSVFDDNKGRIIAELETKYETEKKELEIAKGRLEILNAEKEGEFKNDLITVLVLLIVFALILFWIIIRNQRIRIRQQKKEFELKTELQQLETSNQLQEQRLKISRELHDNIGSQLTFIISSVNNLIHKYKIQNNEFIGQLKNIEDFASDIMVDLRDTIWAMNAERFYFADLHQRISLYFDKANKLQTGFKVNFKVDEKLKDLELNTEAGINIYRIIQEALNNTIRHSGASGLDINIEGTGEHIYLQIRDDGKGFDAKKVKKGNGLYNMKKRCDELGGRFFLESKAGQGTRIEIKFSL
jgi:signal transduction histidine kinase